MKQERNKKRIWCGKRLAADRRTEDRRTDRSCSGSQCANRRKMAMALICCFIFVLSGCSLSGSQRKINRNSKSYKKAMKEAETTAYGKYPECITYTLGKMTGANNSNMPAGDTYENNAYTRYLKQMLNVQNKNVFEASNDYDNMVNMTIATGKMPDIMVLSDIEEVQNLIAKDMVEDLTESFNQCSSDRIRAIYGSYGNSIFDNVRVDEKLYAIPETNIEDGPTMIWLRKDWLDKLGLDAPKTMDDVEEIVKQFRKQNPGDNAKGETVGLVCDTNLVGESGYSYEYQMDNLFATYGAFPKQWIQNDDGSVSYGSIQPQVKKALGKLHEYYDEGVLDQKFIVRTTDNIIELIRSGKCGSFFGPWWAPNNPLMSAMKEQPEADWQPYMIATDKDGSTSYCSQNPTYKYVVVRKGYEHPEIAIKIIDVIYDYIRFEDKHAEGISDYFQKNVDPTASPIVINVDYQDALTRCYEDLTDAFFGKIKPDDLGILEHSYYTACKKYQSNPKKATVEDWAAYTSRITACEMLRSAKKNKIKTVFFAETPNMKKEWWRLQQLEKDCFLEIVTGQKPVSAFDDFVEEWKQAGGNDILKDVNQIYKKKAKQS